MKLKALINCTGLGYENFKLNEVRELPKELGEKLIKFGYVEEVKSPKKVVKK